MAKIVLTMNGMVFQALTLSKERTTIGRGPQNDLVIDSPSVSGEHAMISMVGNDAILEDLNSTNGTQVNGQPIKKHFLHGNDFIELAEYRIEYLADSNLTSQFDRKNAVGGRDPASTIPIIRVLSGANAGKEAPLTKALTTIGHPGVQTAVIAQRFDGFYLSQVEGGEELLVNGTSISRAGHRLHQGDVIGLVGAQVEFVSS